MKDETYRRMQAKFPGKCVCCGDRISDGDDIAFRRTPMTEVVCRPCAEQAEDEIGAFMFTGEWDQ